MGLGPSLRLALLFAGVLRLHAPLKAYQGAGTSRSDAAARPAPGETTATASNSSAVIDELAAVFVLIVALLDPRVSFVVGVLLLTGLAGCR